MSYSSLSNNHITAVTQPCVLIFSATDGSGGAGTIADYRVLIKAKCLPLAIITAVSAQNLNHVVCCWPLSSNQIKIQFDALSAVTPNVVKIGVIGSSPNTIKFCLKKMNPVPVVLDPVLSPSFGPSFVNQKGIDDIKKHLLPLTFIITPNLKELQQLSGEKKISYAVKNLINCGVRYVLVTDINGRGKNIQHTLFSKNNQYPIWETTIPRRKGYYHGSGCYFSSFLAACLAHGNDVCTAAQNAQNATELAIDNSITLPALGKQQLLL